MSIMNDISKEDTNNFSWQSPCELSFSFFLTSTSLTTLKEGVRGGGQLVTVSSVFFVSSHTPVQFYLTPLSGRKLNHEEERKEIAVTPTGLRKPSSSSLVRLSLYMLR